MLRNLTVLSEKNIKVDKKLIHAVVKKLRDELDFSIYALQFNFISTKLISEINAKYLEHHNSTDIITFNYSDSLRILEGEIFISFEDALDNSKRFNVNLDEELLRLIIHGILHLTGYDDMNAHDKKLMKAKENELVKKYSKEFKNLIIEYDR